MDSVQCPFSGVAEGSMSEIMPKCNGFSEIFIQLQGAAHGTGQAADFQCVGEAGAIVVALRLEKNLGLMFQPPKGLAMGDPIHIALKAGADLAFRLFMETAPGFRCPHPVRTYKQQFQLFTFFSGDHDCPPAC